MRSPRSIATVSAELGARAESFCRHYFPQGHKQGNYWRIGNTSGAAGQSLAVRLQAQDGRKAGGWCDFATGEFGDLIDLLHVMRGAGSLKDTLVEAQNFLGNASAPQTASSGKPRKVSLTGNTKRISHARKLFGAGVPLLGTPAAAYLHARGIARFGPALRFHPRVFLQSAKHAHKPAQFRPALLAKITDNQGTVTGCARTYLEAATGSIAEIENPKRILGQLYGNAVRIWSRPDCTDLIVGEGLENTLSVGTALPEYNLVSCLTATHLGLFIPPVDTRLIWIARDNDAAGERAANVLRLNLVSRGITCGVLVPKLGDFNEDLQAFGKAALRGHLRKAMRT